MSEDPTRRYAVVGDEVKVEVWVDHSANLTTVVAFFVAAETEEEDRRGAPEVMLEWDESDSYDKRPEHGLYQVDNVRSSVYELRGTIPVEAPPGAYRLRSLGFRTSAGRWVRLDRERLGVDMASFVLEIYDEHPENTQPTGFRFLYDE